MTYKIFDKGQNFTQCHINGIQSKQVHIQPLLTKIRTQPTQPHTRKKKKKNSKLRRQKQSRPRLQRLRRGGRGQSLDYTTSHVG